MTFDLWTIGLLSGLGLLYAAALPPAWRTWALMIGSVIALYALQPRLPIRYSDYIFPTLTVFLAISGWWVTRRQAITREDSITLALVMLLVIGLSLFRYIDATYRLTPSPPPPPLTVAGGVVFAALIIWIWATIAAKRPQAALITAIIGIMVLFLVLKAAPLAEQISRAGRTLTGQDVSLASPLDLTWLGFSYVAFRLIHTFRDRQSGLLPDLSLKAYLSYIIFFPAIIAGPIDRAERFHEDYQQLATLPLFTAPRLYTAGQRITLGLFKKFVIADSLAAGAALNPVNAAQADSTFGLWLLLYGYALRLFFDFSGYTDIAIGIGILFGVTLPENFKAPYAKTSITAFWQSWHITLSDWVRFYVFSPLSRTLLTRKPKPSPTLIVLTTQTATMVVIGLWHGITWNFLIWGIWHGLGLFIHKQWSDRTRKWYRELKQKRIAFRLWTAFAWLLTFHFVVLGWVWFALPTPADALSAFALLMGVQP